MRISNARGWIGLCAALSLGAFAGCADDDDGRIAAWNPDEAESTGVPTDERDSEPDGETSTGEGEPEPPAETDGSDCQAGDARECLCEDGLSLGEQTCSDAGWRACQCDDEPDPTTGDGPDTDGGSDSDDGPPSEVCYPGADESFTTCFPLHYLSPAGYDYPSALSGNPNYREPIAFVDLDEVDGATMIAPNFRLDEIAQRYKGRYAIVQPHAIESLQLLRDDVGAINVNSAYRSPDYNAGVGGATHSRHMYGDGFDLDPVSVGLSTLENACTNRGGMLVEYNSHVHCDFRFDDVSTEFFGAPGAPVLPLHFGFAATLIEESPGVYVAPADGFDEGEPLRRWTAYDADGEVLEETVGEAFVAPDDAAVVRVIVGGQLELEVSRD